ncbi:ferric reductase-like transmembrane domain-containing protein [Luteococcus peritonei]
MAVVVAIYLGDRGLSGWDDAKGVLKSVGILTGLVSADLMCLMLLLAARIGWLERLLGQDRALARHSGLGSWVVGGVMAHGILLVGSYAMSQQTGWLDEFVLLWGVRDVALAVMAAALLLVVGLSSAVLALRRHLPYELWHGVHLTTYLAVALSIPHQFTTATLFESGWARAWWIGLYGLTAFCLLTWRVLLPLLVSLRQGLVVTRVEELDDDVAAITMRGRDVASLRIRGGQFAHWRFWTPGLVWQQHPLSLSAMPRGDELRITVRGLGRGSARMLRLRPGTRVSLQGPYGRFSDVARTREFVVMIGSGTGIAPIRALLEDTRTLPGRALVVLRASAPGQLHHLEEFRELCRARGIALVTLVGPRGEGWTPAGSEGVGLCELAPWVREADLYVCGPRDWAALVQAEALALGVPGEQLHREDFSF